MRDRDHNPRVLVILNLKLKGGRTECKGILDYAKRRGNWKCIVVEGRDMEQELDPLKLELDGAIVSNFISPTQTRSLARAEIPVVVAEPWLEMLERGKPFANAPYVKMDSYGVGRLAAEYYLKRGYRSFAYVGETLGMYWSAERRQGFMDTLAKSGFGCEVYDKVSARERRRWDAERPRMMRFLLKLPKPTAILAAMDGRGRLVLDACSEAGINVPEEIAVLGVDNDTILCESATPMLSSIRTGGFRRGQRSAEMLDALMRGGHVDQNVVVMEPLTVVTRESTGYDAMRYPTIARAMKFIHSKAMQRNISVPDVAEVAGCSRRYIEMLFRRHVGASIRDTILAVKIEGVKTLLERSNLSIGEITEQCGFARESHLGVVFKKATGSSMRDWRRNNRDASDV